MKDLHDGLISVDKDIHFATEHITAHCRGNNSTQGIETLSHVHRGRVQVVAKRLMQVKHKANPKDGQVHGAGIVQDLSRHE